MGRLALDFFGPLWGLILFAGGIFFVFVVPGLAIAAFRATQRLERQLALLRHELRDLRDRREAAAYLPHRPSHPVEETPQPAAASETALGPEFPTAVEPAMQAAPVLAPVVEPGPAVTSAPLRPAVEPAPRGLEQRLGARGFVWLGGTCIALASFFLVKYSIDEGLLGPGMRVVLGILLGIALLVGGDFMRRKSATIGQALTAAGVAALYASLFASVALYHLVAPALAFVILAALTFVAIGLSLRHGPFVGLVGLAGGFITPAVVSTGEPHPAILLSYLFLLQLGVLWLERQRGWWYLPAIANAGGLAWALLVIALPQAGGVSGIDAVAAPIYLIVVAASVFWLSPRWTSDTDWPQARIVGLATAAATALLMLLRLEDGGFEAGDWVLAILLAVVGAVSGRLRPLHEISAFALAAVPVAGLLTWHLNYQPVFDLDRYLWIAGIVGVLGTGGGYALLWGARNPERWSLLSALYGAAVLALAYWRLRDIDLLLPWSMICLILSGVHLVFAERLRTWRFKDKFYRRAFGVHALACAGFLAAAVPLWVEREWLPVLWALLMPLIAWIANKIEEPWLRRGLWVAAPAVLAAVFDSGFPAGDRPIFNWLAYGLGVPTLSFVATAWLVRRASDLRLMLLLQAGALILGFLLITLEIRHLFHGSAFKSAPFGFAEAGTLTLLWGVLALGTWRLAQRRGGGAAALDRLWPGNGGGIADRRGDLGHGESVPVADPDPRLAGPQQRALRVRQRVRAVHGDGGHGAPVQARPRATARHHGRGGGDRPDRRTARRQRAQPPSVPRGGDRSQSSLPALERCRVLRLPVAWLIYGGIILALAIWRRLPALRHAAAGIIVLVVFEVFLGDAQDLQGLYRFALFLGLGLTLLVLGYLYQRMLKRAEG